MFRIHWQFPILLSRVVRMITSPDATQQNNFVESRRVGRCDRAFMDYEMNPYGRTPLHGQAGDNLGSGKEQSPTSWNVKMLGPAIFVYVGGKFAVDMLKARP